MPPRPSSRSMRYRSATAPMKAIDSSTSRAHGGHGARRLAGRAQREIEWPAMTTLVQSHSSLHGIEDLGRVVADPALEHDLDVLNVLNAGRGVAAHDHEVGLLTDR